MELQNKHLTDRIIAAAIRVHNELGPGFLEPMYEDALAIELAAVGLTYEQQKVLLVFYRGHLIGEHRLDLLIEQTIIAELKAIGALEDNCPLVPKGSGSLGRAVTELCNGAPDCESCRL